MDNNKSSSTGYQYGPSYSCVFAVLVEGQTPLQNLSSSLDHCELSLKMTSHWCHNKLESRSGKKLQQHLF